MSTVLGADCDLTVAKWICMGLARMEEPQRRSPPGKEQTANHGDLPGGGIAGVWVQLLSGTVFVSFRAGGLYDLLCNRLFQGLEILGLPANGSVIMSCDSASQQRACLVGD